MKKIQYAIMALAVAFAGSAFAQTSSLSEPDASNIGNDSARQALREVSVERFEREGSWNVHISPDYGVIQGRLFEGSPAAKEELNDKDNQQIEDTKVLGVKVEFFRRGVNSFYVTSARPIPIEGVTKTVSVWACGRNMGHQLWLLVQDYNGHNFEIWMGSLEFSGWKKLTTAIPPSPDGEHGIIQQSVYHGDKPGLRIVGFRVDCNPMDAQGAFFMYLDDMRAVTDLYDMENKDDDDMMDNW
ncbi:flagellar filament outer layer protein FlaA [Treponema sp.]|uniref:flagellar filament outer layer protein FlaA n=1 Tax=Treponema sp. TaxID=166 RepID=UPI001D503BE6|nr:flagellar filament outer layer protein FlaA [Treponema sp.]MBS7240775.1 flagellar filament protein FlaA [Treponema sp.]MCI6442809.1 flagellar filament outer layer protein FlaA [Spirochaetia bacterium]MDY4133438.1 flagellar filament outer layer protein FlaA [Treponema sp.]